MKNAVIYARYSSHSQTEMSIEGQIAECRRYAEEHDLVVVQEDACPLVYRQDISV